MANKIPSWCKNAVATALGWAHPLTGEQLVSHSSLEDTVDFYRPNAGAKSFLDPNGEVKRFCSMRSKETVLISVFTVL